MSKKELTKEQKKKSNKLTMIIILILVIGGGIMFVKFMNKTTEKVDVYFNPFEYTVDNRTFTEEELIAKLGEPESSEDWKKEIPNSNGKYHMLKILIYDGGKKEFIINYAPDGTNSLVRITLLEEISFKDKSHFLKMFNLKKTGKSKIEDKNITYRAKNVGVADFWIASIKDNKMNTVKITFYDGIF